MYQFIRPAIAEHQPNSEPVAPARLEIGKFAGEALLGDPEAVLAQAIPQTCHDQLEVRAALTWWQARRQALGSLGVTEEESTAQVEEIDPQVLGILKVARMHAIRDEVVRCTQAAPPGIFRGVPAVKLEYRIKLVGSIARKPERWAQQGKDPNAIIWDVYGLRIIVPDRDALGYKFRPGNLEHILEHFREDFGTAATTPDGNPTIEYGGNACSARSYEDVKAKLLATVGGEKVPFELMVFTQSGFEHYKRTLPEYHHNRKNDGGTQTTLDLNTGTQVY